MISQRIRESRRGRLPKMPKNIERLYKEGKCRDCVVVVTRMDFARILGKFTKVKIQYESNSTPKTKKIEVTTPNTNTRLKSNENGMVLIHRNAYNKHPVKELLSPKKVRINETPIRPITPIKPSTPKASSNVLKENNRLKKTPVVKDKNSNINISRYDDKRRKNASHLKHYGIIFVDPTSNNNKKENNQITLSALIPAINKSILPSEEWCIEFFPKTEEPTDDKVYDRIAAELEDLMYNEKPEVKPDKLEPEENKVDDFPSIMDILNDNSSDNDNKPSDQSSSVEYKSNLESSDVEAMLLGKSNEPIKEVQESTPMEVDTTIISNLIEDVAQLNDMQDTVRNGSNDVKVEVTTVVTNPTLVADPTPIIDEIENPHSPSILDEALQKGIEEHLPVACEQPESMDISVTVTENSEDSNNVEDKLKIKASEDSVKIENDKITINENLDNPQSNKNDKDHDKNVDSKVKVDTSLLPKADATHVIFKKGFGMCSKSVMCPKNLKYVIELEGKNVEFLGAPKFISSLEDLQVLLQIVNDTDLTSPYVLC
ncbi:uncharacterized protein ACR2FA_003859 [Aphomia sociella]